MGETDKINNIKGCLVKTDTANSLNVQKSVACVENETKYLLLNDYCSYNLLIMFRKLICPSSGARDFTCFITAYGVQCLSCWR